MAKRATKVLPARKRATSRDDDSLLVRSAESLGRVIGSLQRQVQGTSKRVSRAADDALDALPELPQMEDVVNRARTMTGLATGSRKSSARKTSKSKKSAAGARKRKTSKR